MSKIQALKADALSETPASPGIARHLAFKDEGSKVLRSQTQPGTISGLHHHGDHEVYGYVVSGTVRLENRSDKENVILIGPGDFLHVPITPSIVKSTRPLVRKMTSSYFCEEMVR
jgi:uncharacterized RmlC-like cupin family protein